MEIKTICTIWIAYEDYDGGEIIAVTRTFEDLVDILCEKEYLYDDYRLYSLNMKGGKTLQEIYGNNWREVIKRFSGKKLTRLICDEIIIKQFDLEGVIR